MATGNTEFSLEIISDHIRVRFHCNVGCTGHFIVKKVHNDYFGGSFQNKREQGENRGRRFS